MAEAKKKAQKKEESSAKKDVKRLERMKKQHTKEKRREKEVPLVELLVECGFQTTDGPPTVKTLKSFATKQNIKGLKGGRETIVNKLLEAILAAPADWNWLSADENEDEAEEVRSEPSEGESDSDGAENDVDPWSGWRMTC